MPAAETASALVGRLAGLGHGAVNTAVDEALRKRSTDDAVILLCDSELSRFFREQSWDEAERLLLSMQRWAAYHASYHPALLSLARSASWLERLRRGAQPWTELGSGTGSDPDTANLHSVVARHVLQEWRKGATAGLDALLSSLHDGRQNGSFDHAKAHLHLFEPRLLEQLRKLNGAHGLPGPHFHRDGCKTIEFYGLCGGREDAPPVQAQLEQVVPPLELELNALDRLHAEFRLLAESAKRFMEALETLSSEPRLAATRLRQQLIAVLGPRMVYLLDLPTRAAAHAWQELLDKLVSGNVPEDLAAQLKALVSGFPSAQPAADALGAWAAARHMLGCAEPQGCSELRAYAVDALKRQQALEQVRDVLVEPLRARAQAWAPSEGERKRLVAEWAQALTQEANDLGREAKLADAMADLMCGNGEAQGHALTALAELLSGSQAAGWGNAATALRNACGAAFGAVPVGVREPPTAAEVSSVFLIAKEELERRNKELGAVEDALKQAVRYEAAFAGWPRAPRWVAAWIQTANRGIRSAVESMRGWISVREAMDHLDFRGAADALSRLTTCDGTTPWVASLRTTVEHWLAAEQQASEWEQALEDGDWPLASRGLSRLVDAYRQTDMAEEGTQLLGSFHVGRQAELEARLSECAAGEGASRVLADALRLLAEGTPEKAEKALAGLPHISAFEWDAFLSHATGDQPYATQLYHELVARGVPTFLAAMPGCLAPGAQWQLDLVKALRRSRMIVVLHSQSTEGAEYQREEVQLAVGLTREAGAQHELVPVLLDDSALVFGLGVRQSVRWNSVEQVADQLTGVVRRHRDAEVARIPHANRDARLPKALQMRSSQCLRLCQQLAELQLTVNYAQPSLYLDASSGLPSEPSVLEEVSNQWEALRGQIGAVDKELKSLARQLRVRLPPRDSRELVSILDNKLEELRKIRDYRAVVQAVMEQTGPGRWRRAHDLLAEFLRDHPAIFQAGGAVLLNALSVGAGFAGVQPGNPRRLTELRRADLFHPILRVFREERDRLEDPGHRDLLRLVRAGMRVSRLATAPLPATWSAWLERPIPEEPAALEALGATCARLTTELESGAGGDIERAREEVFQAAGGNRIALLAMAGEVESVEQSNDSRSEAWLHNLGVAALVALRRHGVNTSERVLSTAVGVSALLASCPAHRDKLARLQGGERPPERANVGSLTQELERRFVQEGISWGAPEEPGSWAAVWEVENWAVTMVSHAASDAQHVPTPVMGPRLVEVLQLEAAVCEFLRQASPLVRCWYGPLVTAAVLHWRSEPELALRDLNELRPDSDLSATPGYRCLEDPRCTLARDARMLRKEVLRVSLAGLLSRAKAPDIQLVSERSLAYAELVREECPHRDCRREPSSCVEAVVWQLLDTVPQPEPAEPAENLEHALIRKALLDSVIQRLEQGEPACPVVGRLRLRRAKHLLHVVQTRFGVWAAHERSLAGIDAMVSDCEQCVRDAPADLHGCLLKGCVLWLRAVTSRQRPHEEQAREYIRSLWNRAWPNERAPHRHIAQLDQVAQSTDNLAVFLRRLQMA
jgi:hypothetical protein